MCRTSASANNIVESIGDSLLLNIYVLRMKWISSMCAFSLTCTHLVMLISNVCLIVFYCEQDVYGMYSFAIKKIIID